MKDIESYMSRQGESRKRSLISEREAVEKREGARGTGYRYRGYHGMEHPQQLQEWREFQETQLTNLIMRIVGRD